MPGNQSSRKSDSEPVINHVSSHGSVSEAISDAFSQLTASRHENIDLLYETIEIEALDTLFLESQNIEKTDFQLEFTIEDSRVIVYGDGRVVVSPEINVEREV